MSWLNRSLARLAGPAARAEVEARSIEGQWHRIDFGLPSNALSGVLVTPASALTLTTAYSSINVISTDVSSLPLNVYRRLPDGGREEARDHPLDEMVGLSPDEETTSVRWRQAQMGHVLGYGNGYGEIERDKGGRVRGLHLLQPGATTPDRGRASKKLFYVVDGGKTLPAADVVHVAGLGFDGLIGYSPVRMARQAIGLAIAAEQFGASLFGNGASPRGILKSPRKLSPAALQNLREGFERIHQGTQNANRTAILEEGVEWVKTSIDPDDAQFLATRQFQVLEIARIYRLPPHKIGDYSQSHLANIEASNLDYLQSTLLPWLVQIEQELNRKLLNPFERKTMYVEHNMSALLRGDSRARGEFYTRLRDLGVLSPNDVCRMENFNPIGPAGDIRLVPMNMTTLENAGTPAPQPIRQP